MSLAIHPLSISRHILPLLAAPLALLIGQGEAKAILAIQIFDDGPNLKITVQGILSQVGTNLGNGRCGRDGYLAGQFTSFSPKSLLCTGPNITAPIYAISGPAGYGGTGSMPADSFTGYTFRLAPSSYSFGTAGIRVDSSYVLGQSFLSSATFNNTNLAAQGFTATGLIGTWTIDGTSESINVCIGSGPCTTSSSVPGPLPLVGAGAAFGWSRRLRRRIAAPAITHPKA